MKQAIQITESAQTHLNHLIVLNPGKHIRVSLNNKGCSGHSYVWDIIDQSDIKRFDEKINLVGGFLVIEAHSLLNLLGSTLDWQSAQFGEQFVWSNPNVKNMCGCGESVGF
jgi:iron-sulfur cluster assembly protein